MRGILDHTQSPEEPLPTFVAHMLNEFNKLKSPPTEKEQIELICKHALERYRVALYGMPVPSVVDLLLRAHELHSVLGPSGPTNTPSPTKGTLAKGAYCFKCSNPGFTSRTCPDCSVSLQVKPCQLQTPDAAQNLNRYQIPTAEEPDATEEGMSHDNRRIGRHQGNFRGGRTFHRGNPPSRH
ncbi:hypothetical protein LDENG_00000870 [Lucifuga dentata]|nr:hypothetical protein LDENG_00000870 [Lucifuga dentata]